MFDTLQCYKLCTPQSIKQKIVPFETVPGRKNDPIKESTLVSYEVSAGLAHVFPKTASASLRRSARELQFTREIISQKRGCYR